MIKFKKLGVFFLIISITFICSGCDMKYGKIIREIRHDGFNIVDRKFQCSAIDPLDPNHEEIKFYSNNYAVTSLGRVYQLSFDKIFSNQTNCMLTNLSKPVNAIFDGQVFRTEDGMIYTFAFNNGKMEFFQLTADNKNFGIYNIILSDKNVVKVLTVDAKNNIYYVLKNDGNVYSYMLSQVNDKQYGIAGINIIYNKNNFGGRITDFNYAGNSPLTYVRTENQIYRIKVTNGEQCTMYADIPCKYEMKLDETLSLYQDQIWIFNGTSLVTKFGKNFAAAS